MTSQSNTEDTRERKINKMLKGYKSDRNISDDLNKTIQDLIKNQISKHITESECNAVTEMANNILEKDMDSLTSSISSISDSSLNGLNDSSSLNDIFEVVLTPTEQSNIINLYNKLLTLKSALKD